MNLTPEQVEQLLAQLDAPESEKQAIREAFAAGEMKFLSRDEVAASLESENAGLVDERNTLRLIHLRMDIAEARPRKAVALEVERRRLLSEIARAERNRRN